MNKINIFSNPLYVFFMFLIVSFVNIILPVHFITILLGGIVFISFVICMDNRYYYSLILVLLTFIIIDISQGLMLCSLIGLSFFLYFFILPRLKYILSSDYISMFMYILSFYIGFFILYSIFNGIDLSLITIFIFNFILDLFIMSFL